jgi:hypothetical protein
MEGIGSDYLAGERMAHTGRALCVLKEPRNLLLAPRESDNGFDFPPTAYPGRELFTASLFVLVIMTLVVWGGWKLISLIMASLT